MVLRLYRTIGNTNTTHIISTHYKPHSLNAYYCLKWTSGKQYLMHLSRYLVDHLSVYIHYDVYRFC